MKDNNDKDIFDMLNEVDVDLEDVVEVPMNDIDKKKLKKRLKGSKKNNKGKKKVAMIAAVLAMALIPISDVVISEIKAKFYYEQGSGLVELDQTKGDLYRLDKPVTLNFGGKEYILKNSSYSDGVLKVNMWLESSEFKKIEKEENVKLKTSEGKEIKMDSISNFMYASNDGRLSNIELSFKSDEPITDFNLVVDGVADETKIELVKANTSDDYKEVTPYAEDGDITVGADIYEIKDKDHFTFWTSLDIDYENTTSDIKWEEEVEVLDENGKVLKVVPSDINWLWEYFVDGNEKVETIKVKNIDVHHMLEEENQVKLSIKIPSEGETLEINEKFKIVGMENEVDILYVKNTDGILEVMMDMNISEKDKVSLNSIHSIQSSSIQEGATVYGDGTFGTQIDTDRLSNEEKKNGEFEYNIDNIDFDIKGEWNIDVK
ncbi:hypothetical protein [uncultured Clostridium sp.]|jgi:hypothetical protein|uniref:hypothetical protein n=1 Tax=uncultured Clostridium sp. TaxID=59620 RepID=UPI002606C5B2|nr:hypothetical protein [uncultured Clostridium sp.]